MELLERCAAVLQWDFCYSIIVVKCCFKKERQIDYLRLMGREVVDYVLGSMSPYFAYMLVCNRVELKYEVWQGTVHNGGFAFFM